MPWRVLWPCLLYFTVARPAPKYFSSDDKAKFAACAFDVWGAIDSLGFAGLSVNAASKECHHQHLELQKTVCTASIAGVHATFADVASFLSSAATDCAENLNNPAYCAADSSGLVSALANIAVSASNMNAACPRSELNNRAEIGIDIVRRLSEFKKFKDPADLGNLSDSRQRQSKFKRRSSEKRSTCTNLRRSRLLMNTQTFARPRSRNAFSTHTFPRNSWAVRFWPSTLVPRIAPSSTSRSMVTWARKFVPWTWEELLVPLSPWGNFCRPCHPSVLGSRMCMLTAPQQPSMS